MKVLIAATSAILLALGACTVMDVKLEGGATEETRKATATAKAPAIFSLRK